MMYHSGLILFMAILTAQHTLPGSHSVLEQSESVPRTGRILRIGAAQLRHSSHISCLSINNSSTLLASGAADKSLRLWDLTTGALVRQYDTGGRPVTSIAFSEDGKFLIAATVSDSYVWGVARGGALSHLHTEAMSSVSVAFGASGEALVAGSRNSFLYLWDVTHNKLIRTWRNQVIGHACVSLSPNGLFLASVSGQAALKIWDTSTGKQIHTLGRSSEPCRQIVFSRSHKNIRLAALQSSGNVLSSSTVQVWDVTSGAQLRKRIFHSQAVNVISFTSDHSHIACGSRIGRLYVYDFGNDSLTDTDADYEAPLDTMAVSPDGKILAAGGIANTIGVWSVPAWRRLFAAPGHNAPVSCLSYGAGRGLLASGDDAGRVCLWDPASGRMISVRRVSNFPVCTLAFLGSQARLVVGSQVASVLSVPELVQIGQVGKTLVASVAVMPGYKSFVTCSVPDGEIELWDIAAPQARRILPRSVGMGGLVALSHDGTRIAGAGLDLVTDRAVLYLWEGDRWRERILANDEGGRINAIAFSPDGNILASASQNGTIRLWRVSNAQEAPMTVRHEREIASLCFSTDGRMLACGDDAGMVFVYEISTKKLRARSNHHQGVVRSIAFSSLGDCVASGAEDTSIVIWSLNNYGVPSNGANVIREKMDSLWIDLASPDPEIAFRSMNILCASPGPTIGWLEGQAHLVPRIDESYVERLIKDLESEEFTKRKGATAELEKVLDAAEAKLRIRLNEKPALELRQRLEALLLKTETENSPSRTRQLRVLEILERIGGQGGFKILRELAAGAPDAVVTREARTSMNRLLQRSKGDAMGP